MKKEKKKREPRERGRPVSLYPLGAEEAIKDILSIPPPDKSLSKTVKRYKIGGN